MGDRQGGDNVTNRGGRMSPGEAFADLRPRSPRKTDWPTFDSLPVETKAQLLPNLTMTIEKYLPLYQKSKRHTNHASARTLIVDWTRSFVC